MDKDLIFKLLQDARINTLSDPTYAVQSSIQSDDTLNPLSWYDYNNSYFAFSNEDWELFTFTIKDPIYKVNNYLTVGMHSDSINTMKGYLKYGNIYDDEIYMYWAPSKEYRDNVAYIQIRINKQTKIIKAIWLLTVKFHDYY